MTTVASPRRTLAVGHFFNADYQAACAACLPRIKETFFAWPGVLSCRPAPEFTPEVRARLLDDLRWARAHGVELDTLFNCNCYGDHAISPELEDLVVRTLAEMDREGLFPEIVTTTSPFVMTVLRKRFPAVKIRLSVNMRVHGTLGFEPIMELFDMFYISRERQRDLAYLQATADWARIHGKGMGMQVNSGCLRQCPFQTFHDNMHGHNRLAQSKVGEAYDFSVFRCATNYARGNYEAFVRSTWIRPEDLPLYEPSVGYVKIATRRHPDPVAVLNAYANYSYDGDLARLMDPVPSLPKIFDNKAFDRSLNWAAVRDCPHANDCHHCGRCSHLMKEVFR